MKFTVLSSTALLLATANAWSLEAYCPNNLAHPLKWSGSGNKGCTKFGSTQTSCKTGDTVSLLSWWCCSFDWSSLSSIGITPFSRIVFSDCTADHHAEQTRKLDIQMMIGIRSCRGMLLILGLLIVKSSVSKLRGACPGGAMAILEWNFQTSNA